MHFSQRMVRDRNTFGKKLNSQARTFALKSGGMAKTLNRGLHDFNNFAKPALGFATMVNPSLAPYTAVILEGQKSLKDDRASELKRLTIN